MASIPNVTEKPLSTDEKPVEEVERVTESENLRKFLNNVSSRFCYNN